MSISTIFPRVIVKPVTAYGFLPGTVTSPAAPFTSAGCANRASREKVSACSATAAAPRTSLDAPAGAARELPCCGRRAAHDGSDLVEGHGEHVVHHER